MEAILTEAVAADIATSIAILFDSLYPRSNIYPDWQWFTDFITGSSKFADAGERILDTSTMFHYYASVLKPAMSYAKLGTGSAYPATARGAASYWPPYRISSNKSVLSLVSVERSQLHFSQHRYRQSMVEAKTPRFATLRPALRSRNHPCGVNKSKWAVYGFASIHQFRGSSPESERDVLPACSTSPTSTRPLRAPGASQTWSCHSKYLSACQNFGA